MTRTQWTQITGVAVALMAIAACGKNSPAPQNVAKDKVAQQAAGGAQSLYDKYGGEPTIRKVVDDAVAGVLADPQVAPFFAVIGTPGHDTVDRLKSCLDLQFTTLFGGPGTFPGPSHYRNPPAAGYPCEDMVTAHQGLNITSPVFDKFITDLAGVLKADGVSDADIATIAPSLIGLKSQIVDNGSGVTTGTGTTTGTSQSQSQSQSIPTPTATASPSPTPSATPVPTATPVATATPASSATPTPSATP